MAYANLTEEQTKDLNDLQLLLSSELVPERDREFANSLLSSYEKYGTLSPKQIPWLAKLAARAMLSEEVEEVQLKGDLNAIRVMMEFAKQNLKYPKIRLQTVSGEPVVISIAGPKSKAPGSLNITDGRPYGSNKWYGRVRKDGVFEPGAAAHSEAGERVMALLNDLAQSPEQVASAHGHMSGSCCFCNKTLTDPQSVKVGYGPTCAKVYGLKWG